MAVLLSVYIEKWEKKNNKNKKHSTVNMFYVLNKLQVRKTSGKLTLKWSKSLLYFCLDALVIAFYKTAMQVPHCQITSQKCVQTLQTTNCICKCTNVNLTLIPLLKVNSNDKML